MYDCSKHGYYGFGPCQLCMQELDLKKLKVGIPEPPQQIVKHVHAPGPCPTCGKRQAALARQAATTCLAGLLALAALAVSELAHLQKPWSIVVYIPAAIVALAGTLLPIRAFRHEEVEGEGESHEA